MKNKKEKLRKCHDCGVNPGECHITGCDIEYCSVCTDQFMCCGCKGHDKGFARWTGIWPGHAEAELLGIDLNELHSKYSDIFFLKPKI